MSDTAQPASRDGLAALLQALHGRGGEASRAELTADLGGNRSVLGYLLGELSRRGLVTVDRAGQPSAGGRPSHLVRAADATCSVLTAQLTVDGMQVARVGLGGRVLERRTQRRTRASRSPRRTAEQLADALVELSGHDEPVGIGVAVPSPVRTRDGFAAAALHLGWPGVPFGDLLAAELHRRRPSAPDPELGNDANLAALAESRHGAGRDAAALLYLATGDLGLGGGLVVGGQLFAGAHGYAIEPGHVVADPGGEPCRCGSRGCLEVAADHAALLRLAGHADVPARRIRGVVADVLQAAADDPRSQSGRAVASAAGRLGVALLGLVNLVDADRIVLGGTLAALLELAPAAVTDPARERPLVRDGRRCDIVAASLDHAALIGAGELAFARLLSDPRAVRPT